MQPLAIDHVQLAMPAGGEDRAREFYAGVLGLSEVPKPAPLAANGGAWFKAGDVELHLGIERDFAPARKAHPALVVPDLDLLAVTCRAYGAEVEWDDRYPGVRRFYVNDPFGNRIELVQAPADPQPDAAERALLKTYLRNLNYRTMEAISGVQSDFAGFEEGQGSRTPERLVRLIRGVIGAARAGLVGETYVAEPLATLAEEAAALTDAIINLQAQIDRGPWDASMTQARLMQGPLADAMTYAGQLELLRKLSGTSDTLRLTTERIIGAPAQRIWEAWTDPEKIARWWGPDGFRSDVHELDVRYGGRFVVTMHGPDGAAFENVYQFESVEPFVRIVFTHLGSESFRLKPYRAVFTLEPEEGGASRVTLSARYASEEEKRKHVEEFGAVEGSKQLLERLDAVVTRNVS